MPTKGMTKTKVVKALVEVYRHAHEQEQEAIEEFDITTAYYWQGQQAGAKKVAAVLGVWSDVASRLPQNQEQEVAA